MDYKKLSLNEFIKQYILDQDSKARKYCFILGAGASKQSGIPTGGELAKKWLKEISFKYDEQNIENWKNEINYIEGNEAEKYSEIYAKRFEITPKEGYLFLENIMETIEPSFGYSVLAQILEKTEDRIVITTNFDSLLEDAMFIYTKKRPLTLGHESLAGFINLFSNRPIIAKIHRDLLLSPKNKSEEIEALEEGWEESLATIFKYYTPIVIGYGGNDGSLMKFLEKQADTSIGMFWFYWEGSDSDQNYLPNESIIELINKYKGYLIPIKGFDEMMLQLNNAMKYELIGNELIDIAQDRTKKYHEKITDLNAKSSDSVKEMISYAVKNQKRDWWTIQIEIDNEKDIDRKNEMYLEGLQEYPESHELWGNYGDFLWKLKKDYDGAESNFQKAIDIAPDDSYALGDYGVFLLEHHKKVKEAEELFKKALRVNPNNAVVNNNYGLLEESRQEYNKAMGYYKKVAEIFPSSPIGFGNLANCLSYLGKYEEAEKYYTKAISLDATSLNELVNYGNLLTDQKRYEDAEKIFKRALSLKIDNSNFFANYSRFLIENENYESAKEFLEKAILSHKSEEDSVLLEAWFYRYSIFEKEFPDAEKKIKELLKKDIRSVNWKLEGVVEKAKKRNHSNIENVLKLKANINAKQ